MSEGVKKPLPDGLVDEAQETAPTDASEPAPTEESENSTASSSSASSEAQETTYEVPITHEEL